LDQYYEIKNIAEKTKLGILLDDLELEQKAEEEEIEEKRAMVAQEEEDEKERIKQEEQKIIRKFKKRSKMQRLSDFDSPVKTTRSNTSGFLKSNKNENESPF
jgi:hypothetical protein